MEFGPTFGLDPDTLPAPRVGIDPPDRSSARRAGQRPQTRARRGVRGRRTRLAYAKRGEGILTHRAILTPIHSPDARMHTLIVVNLRLNV